MGLIVFVSKGGGGVREGLCVSVKELRLHMYACKHLVCVTVCVCLRFRGNLESVPRSDRKVDSGTAVNSNAVHLVVSCVF